MEIDLNRYREGFKGKYLYKHVIMVRPPDMPPKVPPKDPMTVGLTEEGLVERAKSLGTPDSGVVGGWDFGLLDTSHSTTRGEVEEGGEGG